MGRLEYAIASVLLRVIGLVAAFLPVHLDRVVFATARVSTLDGNLLHIHRALTARHPELDVVLILEPYSYGLRGKLAYLVRLIRGMYHLQTARLFVVDNAYLPIHVAPHRRTTTVVQVWHAAGALKRFGLDTATPLAEPERTFLHRYYDAVVVGGDWTRRPYAAALRTPLERVVALGSPRTDAFVDAGATEAARARVLAAHPELVGRRVVLYAPTFRGRGIDKHAAPGLDAVRLRAALPPEFALVLKTHPNLDPATTPTEGFDVVADPTGDVNDLLPATDILVTDYSSSVIEFALLRRPIVLLVPDL
ncbi:MAG: CDP-glycerol glycerophosphotransferase family protein, partial [Chloroflexota bacterium]